MRVGTLSRFHLLTIVALALCVIVQPWWLVVAIYIPLVVLGVTLPQLQFFGTILCCVQTSRKVVALTFDDGPDPVVTPALLDLLKRHSVRATFFCAGQCVVDHSAVARRIVAEGHLMANHSFAHSYGTNFFTTRRLREDLAQAQAAIAQIAGDPPKLFRPPVGLTNQRVFRVAAELGLTVVGWTVRGFDRRRGVPARIVSRISRRLRPGAIIVLHDGGVTDCMVVPTVELLLAELERQGYQAERLDELMETP